MKTLYIEILNAQFLGMFQYGEIAYVIASLISFIMISSTSVPIISCLLLIGQIQHVLYQLLYNKTCILYHISQWLPLNFKLRANPDHVVHNRIFSSGKVRPVRSVLIFQDTGFAFKGAQLGKWEILLEFCVMTFSSLVFCTFILS